MDVMRLQGFRGLISKNSQPICFLVAYFILVVLGNLIYGSPIGRQAVAISGYPLTIFEFDQAFSAGFWFLLLMPFVVTPIVVLFVKKFSANRVEAIGKKFPELTAKWFIALFALACAYVLFNFHKHGVADLFLSGTDSVSSVFARFEIRNRLHFTVFIVMQAIVPYLSYAAIINFNKKGGWQWFMLSVISIFMASLFFIMINMKWPVVLYYAGAVLAIFIHTERYAYLKAIVGCVLVVATYLLISTVVFRLAPEPVQPVASPASEEPAKIQAIAEELQKNNHKVKELDTAAPKDSVAYKEEAKAEEPIVAAAAERAAVVSEAAVGAAPILMMHLLSRMSMPYPYYYQEFTDHPAACGGVLVQAMPGPKCRPSTYIYEKMFAANNDQFLGEGTSPAAVHISGYAVGGWPVAFIALLCASVILGILSSLPLNASSTVSAFGIMGALAGYHFSQIPGEGVIFYEHGLFWTFLLMLAYAAVIRVAGVRVKAPEANPA